VKQTIVKSAVLAVLVVGVGESAYAQQPPDVVGGDAFGNTAMGIDALISLTPSISAGNYNTAAGIGAMRYSTSGSESVAFGYGSLNHNVSGNRNSALGDDALFYNYSGSSNTAVGPASLYNNTVGNNNVAIGDSSMYNNTTGGDNTAIGAASLNTNTSGSANTAVGVQSLVSNGTGIQNSAVGYQALFANTVGDNNMAFGYAALSSNTSGSYNTGVGTYALTSATTGTGNNAQGYSALFNTTTGSVNTAQGFQALLSNTTGSKNIGIGYQAGYYLTTGSNNIDIANPGVAGDDSTIRIGTVGYQTAAFLAGVSGANVSGGAAVVVNSSGQLGVMSSSRRYKEDIQPMAGASERLLKLRPVTFRYKQADAQGKKPLQYGLIAEEVAEVFPELVVLNKDGQPETVAYQVLAPLLVNELQKEHSLNKAQNVQLQAQVAMQATELGDIKRQLAQLQETNHAMALAMAEIRANRAPIAMR
jgi:trimeric autotransporter adhesin